MTKDIWIFAEATEQGITEQTKELLGLACSKVFSENQKVCALLFGENPEDLANELAIYGAHQILVVWDRKLNYYHSQLYLHAFLNILQDDIPSLIMFPMSINGRDLAALLSAHLQTNFIPACISFNWSSEDHLEITRLLYHAQARVKYMLPHQTPTLLAFPYRFRGIEPPNYSNQTNIKYFYQDSPQYNQIRYLRSISTDIEDLDLNEADKVVCGGGGIKDEGMFASLWDLASLLNASVGGSRVAVDEGWISYERMIGISGKTLQSNIYIGFGVSGAIQHLSGITDCSTIIAINKNPQSPLMNIADLAIIGDVQEILPRIISKLQNKPMNENNETNSK